MNLLIDLGNTRLKWTQYAPDAWQVQACTLAPQEVTRLLDQTWGSMTPPQKIVISNVAGALTLEAMQRWIISHWSLTPHVIRAQAEQLGVKNLYHDPATLGADRWAALIAVRGVTSAPACVVDCGTAVTIDALSSRGEFLGGTIFPGLRLLRQSLTQGTQGIKLSEGESVGSLARSTADGVAAGTMLGLAGAVERLVQEHRQALGESMGIFLTGGDAPLLSSRLRSPVISAPDLVLKGLARISDTL